MNPIRNISSRISPGGGSHILRLIAALATTACLPPAAQSMPYVDPADALGIWEFNGTPGATQATDAIYNTPMAMEGGAAISPDSSGRSGQAGDRALNFGTGGNTLGRVTNSAFLALLNQSNATKNQLTVVFWQKWDSGIGNSSSIWFNATSGGGRGFQSHLPWSDGNIYFDTSGCCDSPAQRLTTGVAAGFNWQQWHHVALVKNAGAKEIWINGQRIAIQSSGVSALSSDWTEMLLGQALGSPDACLRGKMDDFAVFGTALAATQIAALAAGSSPQDLVVPPENRPPVITGLNPVDGRISHPVGGGIGFTATTAAPNSLATSGIRMFLNGTEVTGGLAISGTATSRTVSYATPLVLNRFYSVRAEATDQAARVTSRTWTFDTADPVVTAGHVPLDPAALGTPGQSATATGQPANLAIDGNPASISETDNAPGAYWELVLDRAVRISRLTVQSPDGAGYAGVLNGAVLRVYGLRDQLLYETTITGVATGATWGTILPAGIDARIIRITLPDGQTNGAGDYRIALAELDFSGDASPAFGPQNPGDINYALNQPAYMVRLIDGLPAASLANDGDYNTFTETTERTVDGYWETDLGTTRQLYSVRVIAYDSGDFQQRLRHATLRLYDTDHKSIYSEHLSGTSQVFDIALPGPVNARYVRVGFENKERSSADGGIEWWLRLREVQAFGRPGVETGILGFSASPAQISTGQSTILSWQQEDLRALVLYPGVGSVGSFTAANGTGQITLSPTTSTEYILVGTDHNGQVARHLTVSVNGQLLPPRISEIMAANKLTLDDGFNDASDWIELHNPNNTIYDLSGCGLSDTAASPMKWTFPVGTSIPAHGYLVVFASGRSLAGPDADGYLHASFSLGAGGESVVLTAANGTTALDAITAFPAQKEDLAYGRDLNQITGFLSPTPGAPNPATTNSGWLADPVFSHTRGIKESAFSLALSHPDPLARIVYSIDGSEPSLPYTSAIPVSGSTSVRASARRDGFVPPRAVTHTYLFKDSVMTSPLMNPAYTQGPLAARLRDSLTQLPSVCVSVPQLPDDRVEREASMEILMPDGATSIQMNAGMNRVGGSWTEFAKKSYKLEFRSEYGGDKLEFPLFRGFDRGLPAIGKINTLDLTACNHDMVERGFYMANRFTEDTMLEMGSLNPHGRFVHLYVNGVYWGQYNAHERLDDAFLAENLGGAKSDYVTVLGNDNATDDFVPGTPEPPKRETWESVRASRGSYAAIKDRVDMAQMIDFMLLFCYGDSEGEFRCAGPVAPGSGFKFWLADADGFLRTSALSLDRTASNGPGSLFGALAAEAHPDFKMLLADRIYKHFFNNGALTPERNLARLDARMTEVKDSLIAECARWGYRTPDNWLAAAQTIRTGLFPNRTSQLFSQLRARGYYPSINPPVLSKHGGSVAQGYELSVSAGTGTIYYTLDGSDPRAAGGGVAAGALVLGTGQSTLILNQNTRIMTRLLSNGVWSALADATFHIAHPLREAGPYVLNQWDAASAAGTSPPSMRFFQSDLQDPPLSASMDMPWTLPYNRGSKSRINGLDANGIGFINTSDPQDDAGSGFVGAAVLALNTLGTQNIIVRWTGGTVLPNARDYGIRLQYRVGQSGGFIDVPDTGGTPVEYLRNAAAGHASLLGPVTLPQAAENQELVELRWKYHFRSGSNGARPQLRLDDIQVSAGPVVAQALAFESVPASAQAGATLAPVAVKVVGANGAVADTFSGNVQISVAGQPGLPVGTTTRAATGGRVVFDNLVFPSPSAYTLTASATGLTSATYAFPVRVVGMTEIVMPGFIQGRQPDNTERVPFACLVRLDGLLPSATYRYANQIVNEDDTPETEGAGNMIFADASGGAFSRTTASPRFLPEDLNTRHGEFTADASGSITRWFITEPSGNLRFDKGNTVRVRLHLNDGAGGDLAAHSLTAAGPVQVLQFGGAPDEGSALFGDSSSAPKDFVVLYDDAAGATRPLAATPVETTGAAVDAFYAEFYRSQVAGRNGRWGAIVPNGLASGVRRVETRSRLTGALLSTFTCPDGHRPTSGLATGSTATGIWIPGPSARGFPLWQARTFSLAEIAMPAIGGAHGDPDGDGVPNLLEFAFDLPPFAASSDGQPGITLIGAPGATEAVFQYRRRTDDHALLYQEQISTDLGSWQPATSAWTGHEQSTANPGGQSETVTRKLSMPPGQSPRFLRVFVTEE